MSSMVTIANLADAVRHFNQKYCNNVAVIFHTYPGDYGLFCYVMGYKGVQYYVMRKTDWFYKFSRFYRGVEFGEGQTFNYDMLKDAAKQSTSVLVSVTADATTYFVNAKRAMRYVTEHKTVRTPKMETKEEASIPRSMISQDVMPTITTSPTEPKAFKMTDDRRTRE